MSIDVHKMILSQYSNGPFNVDALDADESELVIGTDELVIDDVVGLGSVK